MRITEAQEKLLENFSCERLTSKEINRELIKNIENRRGDLLIEYLNTMAWYEDSEDEIAHYLVKSPEDDIVMFFSLKCGGLFDPLDEEVILQRVKYAQELLTEIQKMKKGGVEREIALQLLEQFRTGQDISIEQIQNIVDDGNNAKKVLEQLNYDKEHESNKKIIRVGNTYPSIEKPRYDLCCEFMCQNIKNLKIHKKDFFENFNIDVEDEVI